MALEEDIVMVELTEPFDAAKYLTQPEDQVELLNDALVSGDRAYIAHALGIVARARGGIGKLAADAGLGRQALHRALRKDGNPQLDTLLKVLNALGLRMKIEQREAA